MYNIQRVDIVIFRVLISFSYKIICNHLRECSLRTNIINLSGCWFGKAHIALTSRTSVGVGLAMSGNSVISSRAACVLKECFEAMREDDATSRHVVDMYFCCNIWKKP